MNDALFNDLVTSIREGGAIPRGEIAPSRTSVIDAPDVKQLRASYRLSQNEFATMLGISAKTLRNWEQGRRKPEGPARVLLQVAAKYPQSVWDAVHPTRPTGQTTGGRRRRSEQRAATTRVKRAPRVAR